ncbi:MAG: archaellin/type IV pilin N-terminal domain-containing protein [Nanobdellota archaeon]
MYSKKGLSPLIATVLLLAFAVSIATIVVQLGPFTSSCGPYSAEVITDQGKEKICYNEASQEIQIYLKNNEYDIEKIKVSITGENEILNKILNKKIDKYIADKIKIKYDSNKYGAPQSIIFTPSYNKSNEIIECPIEKKLDEMKEC